MQDFADTRGDHFEDTKGKPRDDPRDDDKKA